MRELFYFFGETIGCAASARWSASVVGMLGVVLPGGLGGVVGEDGKFLSIPLRIYTIGLISPSQ